MFNSFGLKNKNDISNIVKTDDSEDKIEIKYLQMHLINFFEMCQIKTHCQGTLEYLSHCKL